MKLKTLWTACLLFCFSISAFAQLDKESNKALKKAEKYYKKKKYTESSEMLNSVLQKYPTNENLWSSYQEVNYKAYVNNPMVDMNYSIKISGNDSGSEKSNLLLEQLKYLMGKPKYDYYNSIYYTSLSVPFNSNASIMLRSQYVDKLYYTGDSLDAQSIAYFEQGEGEFRAKNFQKAIEYFKKSYVADSNNYKALLYLGDSYYVMEYYGDAATYFRQAIAKQPMLSEPRKYLSDALANKGEVKLALETAKETLLVYPEEQTFATIYNLLKDLGEKKLNRNWVLRLASVNNVSDRYRREQFYDDMMHFSHYAAALEEVKEYYDDNGILKSDAPQSYPTYLEVYSFRKMLEATVYEDIESLEYAREMDKKGMLEPYLLIGLYNVDLYQQYRHFVEHNKLEAEQYINEYLIAAK